MDDKYKERELYTIFRERKSFYEIAKRFIDIIVSLLAGIAFLPVGIIISILIKIDSKGPIFFSHRRLGVNKKYINVYKFRTMVENSAEIFKNFTKEQKEEYERNFKLDDDPRLTRIGKFLRKTSLDELPQLLNILNGDMTLVGPRPIVEKEIKKYGNFAGKLFSVKPGLTGYWQANGRSNTTYDERVDMDMFYIDNKSLGLDFKIVFKTFLSVFTGDGAI